MPGYDPPEVIGFSLGRRIGGSIHASVYEALQDDVDAPVALKVLDVAANEHARQRFAHEAQLMARLRGTRGIVPVFGSAATTGGRPVLVMAFFEGGSLADRLAAGGPLPIDHCVGVARVVGTALATAHRNGIIHGNIRPENVLFNRYGEAALSDFRIASVANELDTTETVRSIVPAYAPPEHFHGDTTVNPVRSDLYSLGATIYAAITGRPPHGVAGSDGVGGLMRRICNEPPDPIARDDVPEDLEATVRRALATDPADRFDGADDFVRALAAHASAPPRTAARPPVVEPTPDRKRARWWAAAVLIVAALVVVGTLLFGGGGKHRASACVPGVPAGGPPVLVHFTDASGASRFRLVVGTAGSFEVQQPTVLPIMQKDPGLLNNLARADDPGVKSRLPAGLLLRVTGQRQVWRIDAFGAARTPVRHACAGDVTVLHEPELLEQIPVGS